MICKAMQIPLDKNCYTYDIINLLNNYYFKKMFVFDLVMSKRNKIFAIFNVYLDDKPIVCIISSTWIQNSNNDLLIYCWPVKNSQISRLARSFCAILDNT